MLPREHGAYGQLLFPLVTALTIGRPGLAATAAAGVAICLFLAHEPLLVLLGERGPRAARDDRHRARRWLGVLGTAAVSLGLPLVALSPSLLRLALVVPAAFAVALLVMIVAGREHTLAGEILSALAFAAMSLPLAVATGVTRTAALTCAVTYAVAFVSATLSVHAVIDYTRRSPALARRGTAGGVTIGLLFVVMWLASSGALAASAPWAALPPCITSCALAALPPSAKRLRLVGWTIVTTSVATASILIVTLS